MMTWDALQARRAKVILHNLIQHLLPTDTAVSKLPALQLYAEQSKGIGCDSVKFKLMKQNCMVRSAAVF